MVKEQRIDSSGEGNLSVLIKNQIYTLCNIAVPLRKCIDALAFMEKDIPYSIIYNSRKSEILIIIHSFICQIPNAYSVLVFD